ncbi:MAG: AMP-binding protein, partial [Selenomonadaceae bacterium]|nr:AMP-binding protein [Selenomonadaceae bacterium]
AGSQIAEGYWKKPELTAKSFVECSFLPGQKMYRTGDLARYNEDGELEYLGRIDTQVKLRGFRIEMGEIENRAAQFAGIEHVAAAVKKEQLILYYTSAKDAQIDAGELRSFLEKTLTEYMVPTVYMPLSAMPMTPSGKIDRKALPEPDISLARAVYEAPVGDMERRLCAAFEQVLGLEAGSVGRNDDFFLLGGSSIKAMLVMTGERIEGLSTRTIFKHKTPRRIAEAMSGAAAVDLDGYEKMARERAVPATSGQLSMIDYQFTNVNSVMHNLPAFYRFDGALDAERLAAAVDRAAKQHPTLSSVFDIDDEGVIVQRMVPDVLKKTAVEHVSPEELKALSDSLMQPFHIFRHPLFRARVFRCDDGVYLFMDMHHTISDGVSQGILLEDIARAYRQEELEPDYYYSYVLKEYENQGTEEYKEAERYFDRLLSGRDWCIIPTPDFDSWGTEAGAESFQGMVSLPEMSRAEKRWGVSRNILAIAAAMLALREYCQRDEIRIDYINNNRTDAYLQHTVGLVFKIFPMAVDFRDFPAVEDFLREVNRQLVEGFAHSICDYGSFDKVALEDALDVNYITNVGDASDLGVLNPRELELEASYEATECRVELYLTEEDGQVNLDIDYQKNAYAEGSMKKFMNLYVEKFRQLVQG